MLLNKITSDIRRSRRGLELCGLASLQNKERQFCVFLPEKGFPACNVFVQTDSQQAAQIIVQLFSCCWFRNRTTKSVRGIMNSDPGNQDVQPRTLPAFLGLVYGSVEILLDSPDPRESCLGHVSGVLSGQSVKTGQQAFGIRGSRVTALMNRCAAAPEGSVFRDKSLLVISCFPAAQRCFEFVVGLL